MDGLKDRPTIGRMVFGTNRYRSYRTYRTYNLPSRSSVVEPLPLGTGRFGSGVFQADGVEGLPGSDEEGFEIFSSESAIGGSFGDFDSFQKFTVGIEDIHFAAVSGVKVAFYVNSHAVTAFIDHEQLLAQLSVFAHCVATNGVRGFMKSGIRVSFVATCIGNVDAAFVW